MNRNELFKKASALVGAEWAELFMVRNNGICFYISMKNGPYRVQDTPEFDDWFEAKRYIAKNWRNMYDEEFERMVLLGPEECTTNDNSEDSSST